MPDRTPNTGVPDEKEVTVMPKGSEQLTHSRKEEIINACASLYETMGFRDITICDIGKKTSFTRTSIYNYFQTKEEIFLALLEREHEAWITDITDMTEQNDNMAPDDFADAFAKILEKRSCMLKLMSMNLYDMEGNCRMENLVAFKKVYARAMKAVKDCLEKFFSSMTARDIQAFIYMLFPFMFGLYPYTSATRKQKEAMEIAGVPQVPYTIYELTKQFLRRLL